MGSFRSGAEYVCLSTFGSHSGEDLSRQPPDVQARDIAGELPNRLLTDDPVENTDTPSRAPADESGSN